MVYRLQEVVARAASAGGDVALVVRHGLEYLVAQLEVVVDRHDGGDVTTAVAVVRRGPDRDDGLLREVVLN